MFHLNNNKNTVDFEILFTLCGLSSNRCPLGFIIACTEVQNDVYQIGQPSACVLVKHVLAR